jgi:hypothetical protein
MSYVEMLEWNSGTEIYCDGDEACDDIYHLTAVPDDAVNHQEPLK